jgi:hypothetical protein
MSSSGCLPRLRIVFVFVAFAVSLSPPDSPVQTLNGGSAEQEGA